MKIFLFSFLLLTPTLLFAQDTVQLMTDLPFIGTTTNLAELLQGLFKLTLGVAVTAAVVIIVINGIRYMTSDAVGGKEDAKKWIQDVIWGLILAFASVLILSTINPQLTQFDFINTLKEVGDSIPAPGPGGGGGGGGGTTDPAQEQAVRDQLALHNISVNKPPCQEGQTSDCTNVGDLPSVAINGLISLANDCGCALVVTGGTEGGHTTHGPGLPMVDIQRSGAVTPFIQNNGTLLNPNCGAPPGSSGGGPLYSYGGSEFWDEPVGPPHWHACFGTQCSIQNCPRP